MYICNIIITQKDKTMKALTEQQAKRVKAEIATTEANLNKELSISEDLQYKDRIEEMRNHIERLNNMLKIGWNAPVFN